MKGGVYLCNLCARDAALAKQPRPRDYRRTPPPPSSSVHKEDASQGAVDPNTALSLLPKLKELRDAGVLTDAEYEEKKQRLLNRI